jgi:hypothetical protein
MHLDSLPQLQIFTLRLPRYIPGFPFEAKKAWFISLFELTQQHHHLRTVEIRASAFTATLPHPELIAELRGCLRHGLFVNRPMLMVICEVMVISSSGYTKPPLDSGATARFIFQEDESV